MINPLYHVMPRVAFFIEPKWAFGSIHYALCKEFYKRGIYADVISWEHPWKDTEKESISKIYDIFVSTPYGINILHKVWNIPLNQCVAILHSKWDAKFFDFNHDQLKGLGSITPQIIRDIRNKGVTRDIEIVRNGIHFDFFCQPPSEKLVTMGYAGTFSAGFGDKNWKRSDIVVEIQNKLLCHYLFRTDYVNYNCMPDYYSKVDCVLVTSTNYEACGLPIMEASASGRLPITSSIGIVEDLPGSPALVVPSEREAFIEESVENMIDLGKNPDKFKKRCIECQEFAREHYDWSVVIEDWISLIVD
jgi:hypothetical protein